MQSLKELFKIGSGPSSSHTMGPKKAAEIFKEKNNNADKFEVILYGSLALTGKGHLTDYIIKEVLKPIPTNINFNLEEECKVHPNTLDLIAYKDNRIVDKTRVYSVGGGAIKIEGENESDVKNIYPLTTFEQIKTYCKEKNIDLYDYVCEIEGKEDITEYLKQVWDTMQEAINRGLHTTGTIPGILKLKRKAKQIFEFMLDEETPEIRRNRIVSGYAYAVSEENASGGEIVTAPTCGACGVLPAVLYYLKTEKNYKDDKIIEGLAVAGLIGNLIKTNASISGAECGCQAEIGSACSMAAAATAHILGLGISRIENSAEVAMEHHLGLTCDPVYGYVQIPCIERNAVAAMRALDVTYLSIMLGKQKYISFDMVVETMYETGKDLSSHYRETSSGGLAKKYCRNKYYNKEMLK